MILLYNEGTFPTGGAMKKPYEKPAIIRTESLDERGSARTDVDPACRPTARQDRD